MTARITRRLAATALVAATALMGTALAPATAKAEGSYLLATASTGGTYYPVGVALSTLIKVKLEPQEKIGMSAINSAGSGENVKLLRDNEVQFAILQGLYGYYAWQGVGPVEADGPQKDLRSVSMLWQNVEQFVVDADKAKTGGYQEEDTFQSQIHGACHLGVTLIFVSDKKNRKQGEQVRIGQRLDRWKGNRHPRFLRFQGVACFGPVAERSRDV